MLPRLLPRAALQLRSYSTQPPSLETKLRAAMKLSMKAKQSDRTTTLKSLLSELQRVAHTPSPPSPSKTLAKAISSRIDAAADFLKSTPPRDDLAEQYKKEAEILKEFVEESGAGGMSLEEVAEVVKSVGAQFESVSLKDMGRVVKAVKEQLGDKAEGKVIADAVKNWLGSR